MPTDGYGPVLRMAEAFALVAVVAAPVGWAGWRLGRRATPPPLPVPPGDDVVLAFGYLLAFCAFLIGQSVLAQVATTAGLPQQAAADPEHVRVWQSLAGQSGAAVLLTGLWAFLCVRFAPRRSWRGVATAVGTGVGGWLLVSPAVYAIHGGAEWLGEIFGVVPEEHPLVKVVAAADPSRAVVLFAAIGVAVPFAEEVIFRGLLLGWLVRRPAWSAVPFGVAALLTVGATAGTARLMAVGFLLLLIAGQVALHRRPAAAAVWATSTLFALVHASVWPTPVPLFLLGLALGTVTVRSGGVLAGTVLHGLFNAVSLVYLVRG